MNKTALFLIASLGMLAPIATTASAAEVGIGDGGIYVDSYRHRHHHYRHFYRGYDRECDWRHGYRHCR